VNYFRRYSVVFNPYSENDLYSGYDNADFSCQSQDGGERVTFGFLGTSAARATEIGDFGDYLNERRAGRFGLKQ
jgi:hypothetical protein